MDHRRTFHLHVNQRASRPGYVSWSATRTLWRVGTAGRSDVLGQGELELTTEGGTPAETGLALFRAALAAYEAQIRA